MIYQQVVPTVFTRHCRGHYLLQIDQPGGGGAKYLGQLWGAIHNYVLIHF